MNLENLIAIIEGCREHHAVAAVLRETEPEDYDLDRQQEDEYECELLVVRQAGGGKPLYIVNCTGAGTTVYEPSDWAEAVEDAAKVGRWDTEEAPEIADANERAGVHGPTGIQYDPSPEQRIAADAERFQCALYREIRGLE